MKKASGIRGVNAEYSNKVANVGDLVNWLSMVEGTRQGKVIKATAKTVHVTFPATKYAEEATISLKREFPTFGQLKGRFNHFRLTDEKLVERKVRTKKVKVVEFECELDDSDVTLDV